MIKNIIFDLDGTLIDSMPVWENVGRNLLIKNGVNPPDDLEEKFKTMSFEESAQYFINELGLKMTVKEIISAIIDDVKDMYCSSIPLKPFVYEYLEKSFNNGLKMCILTSSEADYVLPALKRLKINDFFSEVLTCTSLGMSKSTPEIYDFTAQKMNWNKSETIVFEDALHGVKNSHKAGFYTIGVYDKSAQEDTEEIKNIADKYIKSFKELL